MFLRSFYTRKVRHLQFWVSRRSFLGLLSSNVKLRKLYKNPDWAAGVCFKEIRLICDSELDPTSMMSPLYQGLTCQPTTNPNDTCTLGGYPSYAVNATNVKQIQLAINFARATGIRLVIRNTGHDFGGKSGGAGSLAIWTHYLNTIDYLPNYVDEAVGFSGPAFKAGSGVIGRDIYVYAAGYGLAVFGGEAADGAYFHATAPLKVVS
jgi:hypothetical protein